jgi:hypothetical protein
VYGKICTVKLSNQYRGSTATVVSTDENPLLPEKECIKFSNELRRHDEKGNERRKDGLKI